FRGSTGYGKQFLNAGNKEWGTGVMQHDISDGVKYLIDRGIADPERIGIMGGSYGGYATLAGVTFTPDLYAAGVSIVGPSNIITLLNSIPAYWGPMRRMFLKRVGDPDDPAELKRLQAQSPFFHAKNIRAPLLVIQGANDPRVKQAESDQIVVAMRDLERPVEYLVAPDEGHGFAGKENRLAMFAAIDAFLAQHLGGRHQEGAAPAVAERLAELRVDIATVTLPQVRTGADAARTASLPQPDVRLVRAGSRTYSIVMSVRGQEINIDRTVQLISELREGRSVWRVESRGESPMGSAKDVYYLDASDLSPTRREIEQGAVRIAFDFSKDKISGSMAVSGREMPVDVSLEAPVLGGEAALETVLAALPLAPGFVTTGRTFDIQSQKVRFWEFKVVAEESVAVPAGRFDSFKIEVDALDDAGGSGVIWISREVPRLTVKSEFQLPAAMGGGSVVSELTGAEG
ncbi:MAG: prolyl oligopeptidase family serine peptidase, partial [Pseudomonadales bacterium]